MTRCMYIYLTYVKYLTGKKKPYYAPYRKTICHSITAAFVDSWALTAHLRARMIKVHRKRLTLLGTCRVALLSMRNSKEALHKPSCEIKTFIIRTLIDQSCRVLLTVTERGASTRSCILLKPKKLLCKVSRKYRPSVFFYICRYIIYTSAPRMFQVTYTL